MPFIDRNVRTEGDLDRNQAQAQAHSRAMRTAGLLALVVFAACGGSPPPVEFRVPNENRGEVDASHAIGPVASSPATDASMPSDTANTIEQVSGGAIDASGRLLIFEQAWAKGTPDTFATSRSVCLPKGRYVFEVSSSPSEDILIDVNGKTVITERDYPTEISTPTDVEGCAKVDVRFKNPLHFPKVSFRVTVRPSVTVAEPCDEKAFPKGAWSACLYQGRNQEELIGRETWTKLVVPKQKEGPNGQFDWMSIVARTTVCFPKGDYRFHSTTNDTLKLYVGETLAIDAPPTRRFPIMESKVMPLEGCKTVRAVHTYRNGGSTLELAWAKVGSTDDKTWAVERACNFQCIDQTRCIDGNKLPTESEEVRGRHLCVPFGRASHVGEYCDANHRCSQAFCIRSRCYED